MNWRLHDGKLRSELTFKDQTELARFVLEVAQMSDQRNHHADMHVYYNHLILEIFTHDENEVTPRDHELAREIGEIKKAIN